jgi:hypothetical protein
MSEGFESFVEAERAKLTEARQSLLAERQSIDARLSALDSDFAAINAYEAAKTGKAIVRVGSAVSRVGRAPNGSRRESILRMLSVTPSGMTRGALLQASGVKGDRAGEGSVSNALSALQKAGRVVRQDDGRWAVVADDRMRQAAE